MHAGDIAALVKTAAQVTGLISYCPDLPQLVKTQEKRSKVGASVCISNTGQKSLTQDELQQQPLVRASSLYVSQLNHVGQTSAICCMFNRERQNDHSH
jgi:hypothetical protein